MRMLVLFSLLIFGQAVLAQKFNGFYFEPLINVKTTVFTKKELPASLNTSYFEIKPQNLITPLGFNIGLNFGYKFKNNDKIQLGVFQDESLSGIIFTGTSVTAFGSNPLYGQRRYTVFDGVMTKNFNLLYKKELFNFKLKKENKELFLSIGYNIGITYFYKPNNGLENLTGADGTSFYSPDSSVVKIETTTWNLPQSFKYSFKFNSGFDFTFENNKHEFFTLGISYISNLSKSNYFSFTTSIITITDKYNKISTYAYHVKARGNGIYYQISRRFYPFKWYNLRQQKKLEEYKKANG